MILCFVCRAAEVRRVGQTCSEECYSHMVRVMMAAKGMLPTAWPPPLSMEENEWYDERQERIRAYAEEHDLED